jgi:hypothetical protein
MYTYYVHLQGINTKASVASQKRPQRFRGPIKVAATQHWSGASLHDYTQVPNFAPSRDLDLVIFETREGKVPEFLQNDATIIPPAGRVFLLGKGMTWGGWTTKISALRDFYTKMEIAEPSRIVMATDTDVIWANCETDMLAKYLEITGWKHNCSANPGDCPIVIGVESACFDAPTNGCVHVPEPNIDVPPISPTYTTVWKGFLPSRYLKYPNGGFVMGSYAHMRRLADFMLLHMTHNPKNLSQPMKTKYTDQSCLFLYALKYPERVAFDYAGQIMLNMFLLEPKKILEFNNYTVLNKWTGGDNQVCLMHFSGPWKLLEKKINRMIEESQKRTSAALLLHRQ